MGIVCLVISFLASMYVWFAAMFTGHEFDSVDFAEIVALAACVCYVALIFLGVDA